MAKSKTAKYALVTGSAGLIGSESVRFLHSKGYKIVGIDNDLRKYFFGAEASTNWNNKLLKKQLEDSYIHYKADIRDDKKIQSIFKKYTFDLIIHTAAQPSHDWAAKEPLTDFTVNALGTLIMLENFRKYSPKATFIFTSTNKVYGDRPNSLPLTELDKRYEISEGHEYANGIPETMSIDNTTHSVFGASKIAADIMVQEYGKYFKLHTAVFRGGCLTGPAHSGTQLHGFLAYLVKCIATGKKYTIFGYKGKQVRDNIHSYDLVNMFWHYHQNPRYGEVYNAGGSRQSNISMLEAIEKIEKILGKKAQYEYKDENRIGDHIWYISDVSKFISHYPEWKFTYDTDSILEEMCAQYEVQSKPANKPLKKK
jgi:CDP-paratose 2-epimerase